MIELALACRDWSTSALDRVVDVELRQLRALRAAYSVHDAPEVLVFGDSAMYSFTRDDEDRTTLIDLIRARLEPDLGIHAVYGPTYNARIVLAFLELLGALPGRPVVAVVPTPALSAMSVWHAHPTYGHRNDADEIRRAIASGLRPWRRIRRPDEQDMDAFDRLPAPSLVGARRSNGEVALLLNAKPASRWQRVVRAHAIADHYTAERLTPDAPGVADVADLGARLAGMEIASVAYISPVNHELAASALGRASLQRITDNAQVVEQAFLSASAGTGTAVDATLDSPASHFMDAIHLRFAGREQLARRLCEAIARQVTQSRGVGRGLPPDQASEPLTAAPNPRPVPLHEVR